jgi:hypothetical protein
MLISIARLETNIVANRVGSVRIIRPHPRLRPRAQPLGEFGTMNDDVLAHFAPHFNREDFVRIITQSAWPE